MVTKRLVLSFKDDSGRSVSLTIPDPKDSVDEAKAREVGELIVARKVIDSQNHILASYEGAKIVTTTTEVLA